MKRKEHLTKEGLERIVAIKASINLGLSDELKAAFSDIVPVNRPLVTNQDIPDPMWIAGFASGECCFLVNIRQSKTSTIGYTTGLRFQITQSSRDRLLLTNIGNSLGCGKLYEEKKVKILNLTIEKLSDINSNIIPFFIKYPILGVKSQDFSDFVKVADLTRDKLHLTQDGLDVIINIKSGMNKGRQKF
jgi:hypothetical protein